MTRLITPYGGKLVHREAPAENREELRGKARAFPRVEVTRRELCDLELLAVGALSPLEGFVGRNAFESIVERRQLPSGLPWTIPVTLSVSTEEAEALKPGKYAALTWRGKIIGLIEVSEKFEYSREREAEIVYGTKDPAHPGVAATLERGEILIAGTVTLLERTVHDAQSRTPAETRAEFERRGWVRVVAFQTRNPIHRAHEYLIKTALETVDGLLVHPLTGETKSDDIPADVRWRAYEALLKYFPEKAYVLSALPASMRYGGPREAVHHAILRRNYGASHFIVGRDHAGVGKYYGPFDAHKIFDEINGALGVTILRFDIAFHCSKCGAIASPKTCPHDASSRLSLSGTQVRQLLAEGKDLPVEFTRPEVAEVLREYYRSETAMSCR